MRTVTHPNRIATTLPDLPARVLVLAKPVSKGVNVPLGLALRGGSCVGAANLHAYTFAPAQAFLVPSQDALGVFSPAVYL